ncbi:DISARM system SNF2-like helicase DrmD [Myxococcota bacterium]|nr:DISARM system SNF2-like helicase DrmD [Myxococcota bacterium]MBU1898290.1 DISARM system SNF2-like helicase DrmD [Myxococcota bacterium]
MTTPQPREGMMAVVRNRRAMIMGVKPHDAGELGRFHLVELEYTDGAAVETDEILWEVELETDVLEPAALPDVEEDAPMSPREFDAMVRASRWSALTPSLPFSGLAEDRPPLAAPLYGALAPEAYQLVPVLRALEMPRVALMLADAVGLGKTIQAGMVLRELMLRRRIRRVLVLCPAALRTQWREEMQEKFALPFEVVDRPSTLKLQREIGVDANPWRTHERVITSYHYLKQPDVLEQLRSIAEPGEDGQLQWDLLIVDEAHNLAPASFGVDSELSKMLQRVSPWFEHRVFLTATPHNGHTRSFSGLLETLDPVRFTRKSEFNDEDRRRVEETVIRRLKSEINKRYTDRGEPPRFSERHVEALDMLRFGKHERALLKSLDAFRSALRRALSKAEHQERAAARFTVEVLQKRLLSGPWAFGQSWLALMEGLDAQADQANARGVARVRDVSLEDTDDDVERESRQRHAERTAGAWLRRWREDVADEIAAVTAEVEAIGVSRPPSGLEPATRQAEIMKRASKVKADARLRALETLIDRALRERGDWRGDERLVIFTEYLATLDYLSAQLQAKYGAGEWLLSLYGGMSDAERDIIKRSFNDPESEARILIATDAAGEGLNMQRVARYMLHWDIPWNPARMEQRNGRLDRHGQKRDVFIYHFDSSDDASMSFLGKVLRKRSQTREDRVATDDIFAEVILRHFDGDEDAEASDVRLEVLLKDAKATRAGVADDLPTGEALPGVEELEDLEALKEELDVSPESLRETLETALAIEAGRPRLEPDERGRARLVRPIPALWRDLIDHTLRLGGASGPLLALVFDPAHYIKPHDGTAEGRPVYTPEPDSRLLHLGDALYHRVMSTFARYRFPGGPSAATRWVTRITDLPEGQDALILLTVEELAVNALREPCHHWVRTLALPVHQGALLEERPPQPAAAWAIKAKPADVEAAREVWEEVEGDVKARVKALQVELTTSLKARMKQAGEATHVLEARRFKARAQELEEAIGRTQLSKLQEEVNRLRASALQGSLGAEIERDDQKRLTDLEAELALRRGHYERVQARLADEAKRTLERVLPQRYTLRGEARVYPIAVEIRLPGGAR